MSTSQILNGLLDKSKNRLRYESKPKTENEPTHRDADSILNNSRKFYMSYESLDSNNSCVKNSNSSYHSFCPSFQKLSNKKRDSKGKIENNSIFGFKFSEPQCQIFEINPLLSKSSRRDNEQSPIFNKGIGKLFKKKHY